MPDSNTSATLDALRAAFAASNDPLNKAATFVQNSTPTQGLQAYDLEPAAKNLYPVLTPLRNRIPRVSGNGGSQANWKGVTGIDTGVVNPGITEGRRGSVIQLATKEYMAAYRTLGMESAVTYEADLAAQGFDDLRARASRSMLEALMIAEERIILGGNTTFPLGVTPTPVLATGTTGGTIGTALVVSVICVALTLEGKNRASLTGGVVGATTRVTADGLTENVNGGAAQKSAAITVTTGGSATNTVTATVAYVPGAFAYAWFAGAAGNEMLQTITSTSQVLLTSLVTATQLASALTAADASANPLVHDGLLTMVSNPAMGGYRIAALPGVGLTGDGVGGVVEFDAMLQYMWDVLRLSPDRILISSQEMIWIRKKILAGASSASSVRFTFDVQQGQIVGGGKPRGYLNPFAAGNGPAELPLELHPYMPPGTVLFLTETLPYPMNNINNVLQIKTRRDYYQIDWPPRTRAYEYGVYSDQVLQHYFTPSMGMITNLSPV